MDELFMVLGVAVLVGFIVAIIAYKPVRNKIILTKGYDSDKGLAHLLALGAVIVPALLSLNLVQNGTMLGLIALGFYAASVALRIPKIGVFNALLVSFLQAIGAIWLVVKFVWSFAERMMGGANKAGEAHMARMNSDAAKKAELLRQYEAEVARIERSSDVVSELTGETDALIDKATTDYEKAADMVDREWKG